MTEEQQRNAEFFDRLAKAARQRFDSRRTIEWQICFGLWAAFGVGAGFVAGASNWKPGAVEAVVASAIALAAAVVFYLWASSRHDNDQTDMQTCYFWESAIEKLTGTELPAKLRPNGWLRADSPADASLTAAKNRSPLYQTIMTSLFALVFAGAVISKAASSSDSPSKVTFETQPGNKIQADKIAVGPP